MTEQTCSMTEHVLKVIAKTALAMKICVFCLREPLGDGNSMNRRGLASLVFQTGQDWGPPWHSVQWATQMWTFGAEQTPCGKVASALTNALTTGLTTGLTMDQT